MMSRPTPETSAAPKDLTAGPAKEGAVQSAPIIAPTPRETGEQAPEPTPGKGVNPKATEEREKLRRGAAALDGEPQEERSEGASEEGRGQSAPVVAPKLKDVGKPD